MLIDRLAEFQATGRQIVGQQVLTLLEGLPAEEVEALNTRAASQRVRRILEAIGNLAGHLAQGREPPERDELHHIARMALNTEYSSRKL